MRITYAGVPETDRASGYVDLLEAHGHTVAVADIMKLGKLDLTGADVLVVDREYDPRSEDPVIPEGLQLKDFPVPTVLVGVVGGTVGDQLALKLARSYGCPCLGKLAIIWDAAHPFFNGITLPIEEMASPENFLEYDGYLDVPKLIPTVEVLKAEREIPGLVTGGYGFTDSPDVEVIAGGDNSKSHDYVAIARHGHFVQWGYDAPVEELTDVGVALFLRSIDYAAEHSDSELRVLRYTWPRNLIAGQHLLHKPDFSRLPDAVRERYETMFYNRTWGDQVPEAARGDDATRLAFWQENRPYLRCIGTRRLYRFAIDEDAKSIGIANNDLALLDYCLDHPEDERCWRLWQRYTERSMDEPAREANWLAINREHLFFSDWAGYRWQSLLDEPELRRSEPATVEGRLTVGASAISVGELVEVQLDVTVDPGWYVYPPGSPDGVPIELTPVEGSGWSSSGELDMSNWTGQPKLEQRFIFSARFAGAGDAVPLVLLTQACDTAVCDPPARLTLNVPVVYDR